MLKGVKLSDQVVIVALTVACASLFFGIEWGDSRLYVQLTRYYLGAADVRGVEWIFALRPLIPLLVAPLAAFLRAPIAYGILGTAFWVLSGMLMYHITLHVAGSRQQALAAALLFATSLPTLLFFGSILLEPGYTFFGLLILYTYLCLQDKLSKTSSLLAGALVGVGVLSKEMTLPVVASILLLGIAAHRIRRTFIWILLLIVPSVIWQGYVTLTYGKNYGGLLIALLGVARQQYGAGLYATMMEVINMLKLLAWAHFPLATICSIVGFLSLNDRERNLTFYSLLLPALGAYILCPHSEIRMGVVTYYATMPLAGIGLDHIVRSLCQKPLISRVEPKVIWTAFYLLQIVASITYAYKCLRAFSPPWNPLA
jgi:hypothetical protein